MKPLVSILIPAYNAGEWLEGTLRSALAQTWENKEIIVVDDGSKDDTLAIARRFEAQGIRVFTQTNRGAAATRNEAYRQSSGDYIQWLDADDLLNPEKIELQMAARGGPRTLLSSAWGEFFYRPERAEFIPTELWADLTPAEWLTRKMEHNLHMQTATWLTSREIAEAAGPWDTTMLGDDDGEYFCRVLLASEDIRFVKGARVFYRQAGASSLSYLGTSTTKREAQWRSMELHIGYLRSLDDSERVRKACVQYLQTYLLAFHPAMPDIVRRSRELAQSLGGELAEPQLSWKYAWIKALCGWDMAARARVFLPGVRWRMVRRWDRALFEIGGRGNGAGDPIEQKTLAKL